MVKNHRQRRNKRRVEREQRSKQALEDLGIDFKLDDVDLDFETDDLDLDLDFDLDLEDL